MIFSGSEDKERDDGRMWIRIYRYYAINYPFYKMEFHAHDEWEIMYVVHGRCRVSCREREKERDYDLRGGDYIVLGSRVWHKLTVEKETPCRILNLEGGQVCAQGGWSLQLLREEKAFAKLLLDTGRIIRGSDDGRLHEAMNALIRELKDTRQETVTGSGQKTKEQLLADLLLGQVLLLIGRQREGMERNKRSGILYVKRAWEYIEEHFDQELALTDVACAAGISEGYLQKLFKKETGMSVTDRILRLRVEKAKLLLKSSALPIIDIAVNVGFNSRQHFTATFTELTGCSPMNWRKNRGNLNVFEGFPES